ncbi:citrate synthase/methylcitrate synthase [Rhizobiales bacterium]|uniref:citrate synthase/methylcitrate synthase n=1 Tax=Hongsoonwoonella zoysiae TaxID=2821844 RepID=UPI00156037B8|nr:citrate synthase/methylcitrate synthase [Hongsoonwoonella zoysiae]NRG17238.1 citrate synthase/methylcitrate synthase [Hongsoonwoonella zoysiae]
MTEVFKSGGNELPLFAPGLEGIIAAETVLSDVDGEGGRLTLRGRPIEEIAGRMTFEEAAALLWQGFVPDEYLSRLLELFAQARQVAARVVATMQSSPAGLSAYELMRLGLEALPLDRDRNEAVTISGALPHLLAAANAISTGRQVAPPDPSLSSAEDMLRLLTGKIPLPEQAAALDRYLVTILDHGLNASTFTARVIASTGSDMRSSVIGAFGALKGPLHGGAPGPVLDMLDAIGTPENAEAWIAGELAAGHRLMGFGHRIYRARDPRADVLRDGLAPLRGNSENLRKAEAIEKSALAALARHRSNRKLETNVEFYTAVLLDAVGIDRSLFTPLFAVGRTVGWCAHVLEQRATGKLIRPMSRYVPETA